MSLPLLLIDALLRGARILLILLLAWAAYALLQRLIPHAIRTTLRRQHEQETSEEVRKREDTLNHVALWSANAGLLLVVALTVLGELDVSLAPALASLGIAGVALGFGAQSLVKDVVAGMFILLEDQYRKGDVVRVAGVSGLVEEVNLRRTVLRDLDGIVHSIPNGEIRVASNFTREWSRVNLDIPVVYGTDLAIAQSAIDQVGQELAQDPLFGPMITEAPRFVRVDDLGDTGIVLKVLGVTKPMRQWEVAGEFRRRLLLAFAQAGVEIPFPQRAIIARAPAPTAPDAPPPQVQP
ncbi:MAG: mechanosensitive ion channel family protein [Chloroflexi bacterium]|nr:mechanosensitive ion channel family protein [Chloroflexota bacterium]